MTTPEGAPGSSLQLRAVPTTSDLDARRGLVRIAPAVLQALGARPYSIVKITGARVSAALVAQSTNRQDPGAIIVDDLILANLGVPAGTPVTVEVVPSLAADRVVLAGPSEVTSLLTPQVARLALLGKVVSTGDSISLLQQDVALPEGTSPDLLTQGRQQMQALFGHAWQGVVLTVAASPAVPSVVTMSTELSWADPSAPVTAGGPPVSTVFPAPITAPAPTPAAPVPARPALPSLGADGLPGAEEQTKSLRELLDVGLNNPALLKKLGASPSLGVMLAGPAGAGKTTLVRSVATALNLGVRLVWCPQLASLTPDNAMAQLGALRKASLDDKGARDLIVLDEIEVIAPADGNAPLTPTVVAMVRDLVAAGRAVIGMSAVPDSLDADLVGPGLLSHRIALNLPDQATRRVMIERLSRSLALAPDIALDDVAARTPGFVAADLAALVNAAAQQAACREQAKPTGDPKITSADFMAALATVHPSSMDGQLLDSGQVSLADVGGLAQVKQVLTETVIWPIVYPDTFSRLGVAPTRGILLYGPPGCGKTYIVKALAHDGRANVLSVKGAELLSKWVGESEAGVRQLFDRAKGAAPSLIFLDEIDALAPTRGRGSGDDSVGDRVVAALLTEMDGIEALKGVVVIGATNRPDMVDPALLRPGRLERLLFVPPPDEVARNEIFRAASARTPLDQGVDLAALAARTDGYSGADCAAVIRQAALAAMRRSMDAPSVTAADIEAALSVVKPSLVAAEVEQLRDYAAQRQGASV
ncbi:MAG TPA: AAA family ATPase [Mycobacteriales bacterium]|nr:AAA family ATPase [Mycobacteriales bacterium]